MAENPDHFGNMRRCAVCLFFDTSITDSDGARSPCRVRAPVMPIGHAVGAWPMVEETDWCGEWRHNPNCEEGDDG